MAKAKVTVNQLYAKLNSLKNLKPRKAAVGSKKRFLSRQSRTDLIAKKLSECQKPSEMATLAMKMGMTTEELLTRGKKASNLGQFRMTIGIRMRGIANKLSRAKQLGVKLTASEAAAMKGPVRGPKTTKTKKAKKKKVKKAAKKKVKKKVKKKKKKVKVRR